MYYRLTQFDYDGAGEKFDVIAFNDQSLKAKLAIVVYPNLIKDKVKVNYTVPNDGFYSFQIYSNTGQVVYSAKAIGVRGDNIFNYDASSLKNGLYYFLISNETGETKSIKFVKKW